MVIYMGNGTRSLKLTDVTTTLDMALDLLGAAGTDTAYRVCGTSAALLQGVPLPAGDIDILLAGREDVDMFAALSSFPCLYAALAGKHRSRRRVRPRRRRSARRAACHHALVAPVVD
jgi:hypothetical protein